MQLIHSNVWSFYDIAHESHEEMERLIEEGKRPKPNGEKGFIQTYDPKKRSFKNAFITIVFCGVYLESLLHILMVKRCGKSAAKKNDRATYEEKLKIIGITNLDIFAECKHFASVRREIVHEKAHLDSGEVRTAQTEANRAFKFISQLNESLGISRG